LKAQNIVHLCVGDSHDFGIPSTAGSVYDWNVQNSSIATIVSGNGTELITIDLNSTGVFKLVVEETNQDGCLGYDSVMVEIHDFPSADIVALGPLTFCNGDNVDLQLNTTESIFAWNNGVNNIVNNITVSGNYFATVTDNYGCSVNTNSIDVLVEENPNVDFTIDGFCVGIATSFVNKSVVDPLAVMNYSWYLDNGAILYHDSTGYTYNNIGDYSVSFVAISDIYCKDSIAKDFTIFGNPEANFTYNPFTVSTLYPQQGFSIGRRPRNFSEKFTGWALRSWSWSWHGHGHDGDAMAMAWPCHGRGLFKIVPWFIEKVPWSPPPLGGGCITK
jgi:hypothetical protein